jgi:hypothetical protein
MSKRFDNRRLLYLLSGLILILILTMLFKVPGEKATLKNKIIEFDSSQVTRIILYPRADNGKQIEFIRNNGKWSVKQGAIASAIQKGAAENLMAGALSIKPQSLVAVNKSKWKEFELTDSLATRVRFLNKSEKTLADIMIGKFTYKQVDNPYAGYGGNNIQGTSYVRLYNGKEAYGVEGFLTFEFNRKFDDWRDNTFIHIKKEDITSVKFSYPADSSYTLAKKDSVWFIGNKMADSTNVANYLNALGYLNGQDFKDNFKPVSNPDFELLSEGNNLLNISVKCYKGENPGEYILNFSLNPEVFFTSKRDGIFDKIFKSRNYFLTGKKKK